MGVEAITCFVYCSYWTSSQREFILFSLFTLLFGIIPLLLILLFEDEENLREEDGEGDGERYNSNSTSSSSGSSKRSNRTSRDQESIRESHASNQSKRQHQLSLNHPNTLNDFQDSRRPSKESRRPTIESRRPSLESKASGKKLSFRPQTNRSIIESQENVSDPPSLTNTSSDLSNQSNQSPTSSNITRIKSILSVPKRSTRVETIEEEEEVVELYRRTKKSSPSNSPKLSNTGLKGIMSSNEVSQRSSVASKDTDNQSKKSVKKSVVFPTNLQSISESNLSTQDSDNGRERSSSLGRRNSSDDNNSNSNVDNYNNYDNIICDDASNNNEKYKTKKIKWADNNIDNNMDELYYYFHYYFNELTTPMMERSLPMPESYCFQTICLNSKYENNMSGSLTFSKKLVNFGVGLELQEKDIKIDVFILDSDETGKQQALYSYLDNYKTKTAENIISLNLENDGNKNNKEMEPIININLEENYLKNELGLLQIYQSDFSLHGHPNVLSGMSNLNNQISQNLNNFLLNRCSYDESIKINMKAKKSKDNELDDNKEDNIIGLDFDFVSLSQNVNNNSGHDSPDSSSMGGRDLGESDSQIMQNLHKSESKQSRTPSNTEINAEQQSPEKLSIVSSTGKSSTKDSTPSQSHHPSQSHPSQSHHQSQSHHPSQSHHSDNKKSAHSTSGVKRSGSGSRNGYSTIIKTEFLDDDSMPHYKEDDNITKISANELNRETINDLRNTLMRKISSSNTLASSHGQQNQSKVSFRKTQNGEFGLPPKGGSHSDLRKTVKKSTSQPDQHVVTTIEDGNKSYLIKVFVELVPSQADDNPQSTHKSGASTSGKHTPNYLSGNDSATSLGKSYESGGSKMSLPPSGSQATHLRESGKSLPRKSSSRALVGKTSSLTVNNGSQYNINEFSDQDTEGEYNSGGSNTSLNSSGRSKSASCKSRQTKSYKDQLSNNKSLKAGRSVQFQEKSGCSMCCCKCPACQSCPYNDSNTSLQNQQNDPYNNGNPGAQSVAFASNGLPLTLPSQYLSNPYQPNMQSSMMMNPSSSMAAPNNSQYFPNNGSTFMGPQGQMQSRAGTGTQFYDPSLAPSARTSTQTLYTPDNTNTSPQSQYPQPIHNQPIPSAANTNRPFTTAAPGQFSPVTNQAICDSNSQYSQTNLSSKPHSHTHRSHSQKNKDNQQPSCLKTTIVNQCPYQPPQSCQSEGNSCTCNQQKKKPNKSRCNHSKKRSCPAKPLSSSSKCGQSSPTTKVITLNYSCEREEESSESDYLCTCGCNKEQSAKAGCGDDSMSESSSSCDCSSSEDEDDTSCFE